jgi:hypothetical protein
MARGAPLHEDLAFAAGLWWLKTGLLWHHPATRSSEPDGRGAAFNSPVDQGLYSWMVDGAEPPSHVSVWLSRRAESSEPEPTLDVAKLYLPEFSVDGILHRSHVARFGILDLYATLLVHPGWTTVHPLEATGHAVRIWPWDGGALDSSDVVECGREEAFILDEMIGLRMRLMLASGYDPLAEPMELLPGWQEAPLAVPHVRGGALLSGGSA